MFGGKNPKTLGELIRQYRNQLKLGQADLAREIGKQVKGTSYNSSYVSKWENNQDISELHFLALLEYFKSRLGNNFDEEGFREAYSRYAGGGAPSEDALDITLDSEKQEALDSAERVLRGESGIDQDVDPEEESTESGGRMGNQDPFSSMDRRSTAAVRRTIFLVLGVVGVIALVAALLYVGRGLVDFAAGQMAEQDIAREATRQAFATVTKEAYELDARLTSEVLSAKSAAEVRNAEATVVAIAAISTAEAAMLQATMAAESLVATREKGTAVTVAQSTSEAFETAVAANRTATAMVRIMTAEANTPTPIPTSTPLPTLTPTWTKQPTHTPTNTPLPTQTPPPTPEPTQTPYPTATPTDTPIPTPTPTKTPVPNTEPGTVLSVEDIWYEDEMAMRIDITRLNATVLEGNVFLTNLSDNEIFINWTCLNIQENSIWLYCDNKKWWREEDRCRLNTVLESNQTQVVDTYLRDTAFRFEAEFGLCDTVTIEVNNLSRIDKASWLIDIPN